MSNWDRHYTSGGNHNFNHRSGSAYQQNGSSSSGSGNRRVENWQNYYAPENNGMINQLLQANPLMFVQTPSNFSTGNEPLNQSSRPHGYSQGVSSLELTSNGIPVSGDISNDIWTKAANSSLTPTAGEFIPSLTYQSTSYQNPSGPELSRPLSKQTSTSGRSRNYQQKNHEPLKGNRYKNDSFPSSSSEKPHQNSRWAQYRGPDRGRHSGSKSNKTNQMLEDLKAEGRKKLLEEAAGLIHAKPAGDSSSQASHSRSSGTDSTEANWRAHNDHGENGATRYQDYRKNSPRDYTSSRNDKQRDQYNSSRRYSPPNEANSLLNNTSRRDENNGQFASPRKERNYSSKDIAVSQRERLTEQLNRGTLECLVCCERVRQFDQVWSCCNCFHVLHLRCIIKWAKTSRAETGWRCPACQNVTMSTPQDYYCFCSKTIDPEWNRSDTAHSCGEVCNRDKVNASEHYVCIHRCTLLCHPGPCPPCSALVTRKCGCGKTSQTVQCGQIQPLLCGAECGKTLNCGEHVCKQVCHLGECRPCEVKIIQNCFCGKESREAECDGEASKILFYACGGKCSKKLNCGHHPCSKECHDGPCGNCSLDPSMISHCFCGKTELTEDQKRTSCLDPVPTCTNVCGKKLNCGQPSSPHTCNSPCHEGPCPPCEESTLVRCRCGHMDREIPCTELTTKADDARCQKKCTKKRNCGKHKCNQFCCIDLDHVCPFPCNHMLTCGQHRCEQLCHRGHCQPCLRSSFEELYCECGLSVLFPPIPCGTRPPPCSSPCSRQHSCDHPVLHNCHSLPECPPCSVLTAKYCHGKHELRKTVPCHLDEFSCGLPCGKPLSCGRHKCISPCHGGECLKPGQTCKQPCIIPRELCGHACNNACHDGECVDTPCKETVVVTCLCGTQSTSRPCYENNGEYRRIATAILASKMADVQLGRSVHLGDMQGARKMSLKTLDCNEECRLLERNRRLAIGLQIRNPDLSSKLTPRYSDFMRGWAKKDPRFCQNVHDKLTELVQLAKQSKQKSRSYSFETMNREKRQFVHECCEHFGCESVAYDAEPKRNVVATAQKDRAWMPSYSLLEVLRREMGHRKPVPLNNADKKPTVQQRVISQPVRLSVNQTMASITAGNSSSAQPTTSFEGNLPTTHRSAPPVIDYFMD